MQNNYGTTRNRKSQRVQAGLGMANGKGEKYYTMEINRVEAALSKTESEKLKRDYGKYLKKLYRERSRLIGGKFKYV